MAEYRNKPGQRRFDDYSGDDAPVRPAMSSPAAVVQPPQAPASTPAATNQNTPGPVTMTPEERRYRLNQLLERRRAALDGLRNIGPSIGQTPDQAALRASLIGERRDAEQQIRPLDALEAAARPTIAGDDPRAIAGRRSLAQQAAQILGDRAMQPPEQAPMVKGPADFADDAKMRSMGMNPAAEADQIKFREMTRLSGRQVREPAAPVATVQGPGSSPSADQIFNEFQDNARRSSESQPRERADKAARVSAAEYAAGKQEEQRRRNEDTLRQMQALAMRQAAAPVDAAETATRGARADARMKESQAAVSEKYGDRSAEADIAVKNARAKGEEARAATEGIKANVEQEQLNQNLEALKQAKQEKDPNYLAAQRLVAELASQGDIAGKLAGSYSPLNSGESLKQIESITSQLTGMYDQLTPLQKEAVARAIAQSIPPLPNSPAYPSLWNLGDYISRDISRIRTALGSTDAAYGRLGKLQEQINRLRTGQAAPRQ